MKMAACNLGTQVFFFESTTVFQYTAEGLYVFFLFCHMEYKNNVYTRAKIE